MKKFLAIILAMLLLAAFCSCREQDEEDEIHYDLIKKYSNDDTYYINVYKDLKIENFGTKYGVSIYDVMETDTAVQYYYIYEGTENTKIEKQNQADYQKYLEKQFGLDQEATNKSRVLSYNIGDGYYIKIMPYYMKNDNGVMLVVQVPRADMKLASESDSSSKTDN